MKRFLAAAGFALTLLPQAALAAESEICNALKGVEPVSEEYVKKVLERADKGLENVRGSSPNTDFEKYLPSWARQIGGALNGVIDSYLTLSTAKEDLLSVTTCQHVDGLLLDCKIEEAQAEMQKQLEESSIWGIMQAQALIDFLRERKVHLSRGALNPGYEDPTWNRWWRFDGERPSSASSASSAPAMCPFDSDYGTPGSDGFGCDDSVLGRLTAYPPAQEEVGALSALKNEVKKYKDLSHEFAALERDLCELHGGEDCGGGEESEEEREREHRKVSGCRQKEGEEEEEPLPEDLRLRSVRSPFSYEKDQIAILSDFLGKRAAEGATRGHSDDLKNPDEFDGESEKEREKAEDRERESRNPFIVLFRDAARRFFEGVSERQGRQEAAVFASTPDGTLEAAHALQELRESVGELSRLAEDKKEGLRSFVIGYAYFLRRTCVYRPCNIALERILRTAYADECFPYTDGSFLGDSEGSPRWKKCAEEACIEVEGVELPKKCEDVLPKAP